MKKRISLLILALLLSAGITFGQPTFTQNNSFDPAKPGAIGGTTPAAGTFTTITGTTGTLTTAIPDNTATTQAATTAFAKSQDAVLARSPNQGVNLTYAASGSSGITIPNNANLNIGAGDFFFRWKGILENYTAGTTQYFLTKKQSSSDQVDFYIDTTNKIHFYAAATGGTTITINESYASANWVNGTVIDLVMVGVRETASVAGSIACYSNGVLFATMVIPAGTPANFTNTAVAQILGLETLRNAGTCFTVQLGNRALTAAEVLGLYRNGVAPKHRKASQTALTSGTLVIGQEYTIDTFVAGDNFTNVGGTNVTGNVFVATGATPTTWANSSSLRATGATLILEEEGIQPSPGQWLDSSSNKLHAMQPATGSSLTRYKKDFEFRWVNTWAGTHEAQYVGGANQNVLPDNAFIDSIIVSVTGGTIEDIVLGDGSDVDRFVALTTGLAAGSGQPLVIANHMSDGTNKKLVVDPDANFTGSISWLITGTILEN